MAKIQVLQTKSGIGAPEKQRRTLKALGLRHQHSVIHEDNPAIRGMIFQVRHLVQVTEQGQEQ